MAEKQETVDDIIAEMLGARTEFPFVYLMGEPDTPEVIDLRTKEIIEPRKINIRRVTVKELADRFEAALKRECGNYAAMREALEYVLDFDATDDTAMEDGLTDGERVAEYADHIEECQKKARAALASPPRNCDVGTAKEQLARFIAFCKGQRLHSSGHADTCNPKCPCRDGGDVNLCALTWAQMPYEEGGAR